MAYRDYKSPGVNVIIERQEVESALNLTDFLPVFIGTGMTSRSRVVENAGIKADVSEFPNVLLEWDIMGNFNTQIFNVTDFTVSKLEIHKEVVVGTPVTLLVENVDYEIVEAASLTSVQGRAKTVIKILDTAKVTNTDLVYDFDVTLENTDDDFDLRLITSSDRYYAREIFGPIELVEEGNTFFNDVAIAAEIAFRTGVEKFFYLEVPREYGVQATKEAIIQAYDKVYYKNDAYRIVPLTLDADAVQALNAFTTALSNPVDRREVVGFVGVDPTEITSIKDIDELVEKVGGLSSGIDNERIANIFGGESVEMVIANVRYVLPMYFMNAAVAAFDTTIGMAEPLSTREINVFVKLNGPRFRPRQWDMLAKHGVFVVYQNNDGGPVVIRHQLTTKQSETAEYQEYSIIKNFDAVTKRLRDRMAPYAGRMNITDGYLERIDASFTSAVVEVKDLGWARDIQVLSPWALRVVGTGDSATEDKRNLVAKFKLVPVYPANNLDIYLIV
jgi:hypothetical protein